MKILHIGLCVQEEPYNGFQQAFIDVFGKWNYKEINCGDANLNAKAIKMYDEFKPNIVFIQIQAPNIIALDTIKHFKDAKVINWNGDIRHETPQWMVELAPYCISAFSNNRDVNYIRSLGYDSEFLEIGYNELIYTPAGEKKGDSDIVFMANNYGNMFPMGLFRQTLVNHLKIVFANNFSIYGSGWGVASGNLNYSQNEEACYYRGSKIAINCSNFDEDNYSSDRLLRILGSGAMCLSLRMKGKELVNGEHLVYFDSIDDCILKIKHYLQNEEERKIIAKKGNEYSLKYYTFTNQVENIKKICGY